MLNTCASRFADFLLKYSTVNPNRKAVYVYGLELLFSTCCGAISILLTAGLANCFSVGAIFLAIYVLLRFFCGGYHATTHGRCFLSSNFTFALVLIFTNIFTGLSQKPLALFFLAAAAIIIGIFSPVQNKNHPLSLRKLKQNKRIAFAILFSFIVIFTAMYFLGASILHLFGFSLFLTAVAVSILIPKLFEKGETNND